MRTNSFIKLITKELNVGLRDKNMTPNSVDRKQLRQYIDKMKNKIQLFVRDQVKNNTVAIIKCECKHLEISHSKQKCSQCDCVCLTPIQRHPLLLALEDDWADEEKIFHSA